MRILITGSSGFVGQHLTRYFNCKDHNYEVVPFDIKKGWDVRDGKDVNEFFDTAKPEAVIHLAWIADARRSNENPYESFEVGVLGTLNVLEASSRVGVKRFCFMNSSQTYGTYVASAIREYKDFNPENGYARAKVCAVHAIEQYRDFKSLPTVIFTSWEIFGEKAPPLTLVRRFVRQALQDEEITLYCFGKQVTDFNYIENVCLAYELGLTDELAVGKKFNVGSGQIMTLEHLVKKIKEFTGSNSKIVFKPPREGEEVMRTIPDITLIQNRLNYTPTVSFEEGLHRVIEWERRQLKE